MSKDRKARTIYGLFVGLIGVSILVATIVPAVVHGYGEPTGGSAPTNNDTSNKQIVKERMVIKYISYSSTTVEDDTMEYGTTTVRTKGVNGEETYTYEDTYEGAKKVSEKLVKREVTKTPINEVVAKGTKIIWRCEDVTSFDRNPYNDNKCTSSTGEVRYLCDSDAEKLDSTYSAGKSGAKRYNI